MTGQAPIEVRFAERFGHPPDGVWFAPGRVNLIGEHTDYNAGFVLPIALPLGVRAAVARRGDDLLRIASCQEDGVEDLTAGAPRRDGASDWSTYVAGVVWALHEAGVSSGGLEVLLDGDVPAGAGLSSSAAVECAVGLAVAELSDRHVDRAALARLAQLAENEYVGVPSGIMDQFASLLCTEGHAMLLDTRSLDVEQVPLLLEAHDLALLVIDTGASRRLAAGEYATRRRACEESARILGVEALRDVSLDELDDALGRLPRDELRRRVRHVVTENGRVLQAVALLRSDEVSTLGPLFTASHASLRDDYEVSCVELDAAVDAALEAGALGARLTGAGFGGCAIALVPAPLESAVVAQVERTFRRGSLGRPRCVRALPSGGARRLQ